MGGGVLVGGDVEGGIVGGGIVGMVKVGTVKVGGGIVGGLVGGGMVGGGLVLGTVNVGNVGKVGKPGMVEPSGRATPPPPGMVAGTDVGGGDVWAFAPDIINQALPPATAASIATRRFQACTPASRSAPSKDSSGT